MPGTSSAVRMGRAFVEIFADDSKLSRDLRRASAQIDRFGTRVRNVGAAMLATAGAAAAPIVSSLRVYADFGDQMNQVRAITRATGSEFRMLSDQARELGGSTSFMASQVAGAQTELGRAGFRPEQIEQATPAILSLARATGIELSEAASIAGNTMRQFGLQASDVVRIADRLTFTANNSNNSITDLGEAMKFAGPVAAGLGMSLEDTLAIVGTLGNIGIQGTMAGNTIKRLAVIGAASAEKLEGIFGRSFRDAAGDALPLIDVLETIDEATRDLGSAERMAKLNRAFGLLGITGAQAIGRAAGSTRELSEAMQKADGVAEQTAKTMDEGLGGSVRKFLSAVEAAQLSLGDALAKQSNDLVAYGQAAVGALTEWIGKNRETVITTVKTIAKVAALGAGLLVLGGTVKLLSFGFGALTTAMNFAAGALTTVTGQAMSAGMALSVARTGMIGLVAAGVGLAALGVYLADLNIQLFRMRDLAEDIAAKRTARFTAEIEAAMKGVPATGEEMLRGLEERMRERPDADGIIDPSVPIERAVQVARELIAATPDITAEALAAQMKQKIPDVMGAEDVKAALEIDPAEALQELRERIEREQTGTEAAIAEKRAEVAGMESGMLGNALRDLAQEQLNELKGQRREQNELLMRIDAAMEQLDTQRQISEIQKAAAQITPGREEEVDRVKERVMGTFSGALLDRMSAAGPLQVLNKTEKNTKETADAVKEIADVFVANPPILAWGS